MGTETKPNAETRAPEDLMEKAWEVARTIAAIDKQLLSSQAVEAIAAIAAAERAEGATRENELRRKLMHYRAEAECLRNQIALKAMGTTPDTENSATAGAHAQTPSLPLEDRVEVWVRSRIGAAHMHPRERAIRLLEEAAELAQAEGVTWDQAVRQIQHVYARPAGKPSQEAGGVAVCLLGWCAANRTTFEAVATAEVRRIERKPLAEIRGSVARKADADLVTCVPEAMEP